jgi:eukaryotic-like serine/threonine-protein kinase
VVMDATSPGKRTILGGYEILGKLGRGTVGTVFKARQISVDRVVALKVLPRSLARDTAFVDLFRHEARAAAKLNHPNIVQVFDAGEDQGYYFFAMELVDGPSVRELLDTHRLLPERRALEIARDVARALEYAHAARILHRDIKPGNILIARDGSAKLADLSLARPIAKGDETTADGRRAQGTANYISPEQVGGEVELDGRADLYSLAATLYHMLVGSPPYSGETALEIKMRHLSAPVPDAHRANPQVSVEAAGIVHKAMNKNRNLRQESAEEFRSEIEELLERNAARSGPARGGPGGRGSASRAPEPSLRRKSSAPASVEKSGTKWKKPIL